MHKNAKRALAIAAVAPLAVVGMTGSAVAARDNNPTTTKNLNVVSTVCDHPDFSDEILLVEALVTLEAAGTGADVNDIQQVRVYASDAQGVGDFLSPTAQATSIRVNYFSDDDFVAAPIFVEPTPVYSKTYTGSGVTEDGRQTFDKEKDNVNTVGITVWWSKIGTPTDEESLTCYSRLRGIP